MWMVLFPRNCSFLKNERVDGTSKFSSNLPHMTWTKG